MFNIPKIEDANFYLELAIKQMQDKALLQKQQIAKKYSKIQQKTKKEEDKLSKEEILLKKRKELEISKITTLNLKINKYLKKITDKFPKEEKLEQIYIDLINSSNTPISQINKAIENINNLCFQCEVLTENTIKKIQNAKTQKTCGFIINKHLGKISNKFKKNSVYFKTLSLAKQFLNKLPKFENIYTIAIAGYPNVGKSTLMKKLTNSNVEIQNYPFTTKGLMFGYLYKNKNKITQLIDTPGLLGRKKQNLIEKKATIILNNYCSKIIFVIDLTQSCGYSIEKQFKLLQEIKKKSNKDILIYLSKTDLYKEKEKKELKNFKEKLNYNKIYQDYTTLKKEIIKYSSQNNKFNINNIKRI